MKTLAFFVFIVFFVSACSHTSIAKYGPDGKPVLKASNTSLAWDREAVTLDLVKSKEDTALQIGIGKSGGSKGLDKAIAVMSKALETLKALKP
jgi:hypothetical protein